MNTVVAPNGKAYIFGGVLDVNEDEDSLEGQFSNEMHILDLSTFVWRLIELSGKKEKKTGKSKSSGKSIDEETLEHTTASAQTQGN